MTRRGFTLVEAVLASAASATLALAACGIALQTVRFRERAQARLDTQRSARAALALIMRSLSEARGRTVTVDRLDAAEPYCSRLSFTDAEGRAISFYQQGTLLVLQVRGAGASSRATLADDLYQLLITYPDSADDAVVGVSLTFAGGGAGEAPLQVTLDRVRLENHDAS